MIRKKILYVHITKISASPVLLHYLVKVKNVIDFDSTSTDS